MFDINVGGASTQVLNDPTTGIPDIELDAANMRIYWTDYANGQINSASYNATGNLGPITTEVSGLINPYGLAIELEVGEPAEPRTKGFWKNHEDETTEHLPITIGDLDVNDFDTATDVFNVSAKNAHDMLAAQLLAAEINVWNGVPSCDDVDDAISDAQSELAGADYTGPGTTTAPQKGDKGAVNAIKDVLDDFNNNGCS